MDAKAAKKAEAFFSFVFLLGGSTGAKRSYDGGIRSRAECHATSWRLPGKVGEAHKSAAFM